MNTTAHADASVSPPPTPTPALPVWVGSAAFALVLAALFGSTFAKLVVLWWRDPNYNHGFLVFPIAVLLGVWTYLRTAGPVGTPDRRLGWFALVLGGLSHLVATLFVVPLLDFLGLFFLVRGGLLMAGGRAWASAFTFPLGFLLFLFPLPPTWLSTVALWLQDIASRVSETILSLFVVCTRNGHTIRIAGLDGSLVVAEECSGTRQIVAFVALAALYGHLTGRHRLYKLLLLLLSIPVAVFANVMRVVLMNLGAYWFGTNWMTGWMHDLPALFSLPVGLVLFFVIDRTLTRIFAKTPVSDADAKAETPTPELPADFGRRWTPAIVGGAGLLAVSLLLQWHLSAADARSYPPIRAAFDTLPLRFPPAGKLVGWEGRNHADYLEQTRKSLPFHADDLLFRQYHPPDGSTFVAVYMVHSRLGEDRKHHPEICLREVSGAPEDPALPRKEVPLATDADTFGRPWAADPDKRKDQRERKAQRFLFRTGGSRSTVVYYWYYSFTPETVAHSPLQMIHQQIGSPPPSVTVQVYAPYDERARAAMEESLLPQLDAALRQTVLPANTVVGCDRLPVVLVRR